MHMWYKDDDSLKQTDELSNEHSKKHTLKSKSIQVVENPRVYSGGRRKQRANMLE